MNISLHICHRWIWIHNFNHTMSPIYHYKNHKAYWHLLCSLELWCDGRPKASSRIGLSIAKINFSNRTGSSNNSNKQTLQLYYISVAQTYNIVSIVIVGLVLIVGVVVVELNREDLDPTVIITVLVFRRREPVQLQIRSQW